MSIDKSPTLVNAHTFVTTSLHYYIIEILLRFSRIVFSPVANLNTTGDKNICIIYSETMTNTDEDLRDDVHLSLDGATKLAEPLAPILRELVDFTR